MAKTVPLPCAFTAFVAMTAPIALTHPARQYTIRGARMIEALERGKHVIGDKPLCTRCEHVGRAQRRQEREREEERRVEECRGRERREPRGVV